MPYNPQIENDADKYTYEGLASAGKSIGSGLGDMFKDHKMTEAELSMLAGKAQAYHDAGIMQTPDYQKFMTGPINTKRSLITQADTTLLLGQQNDRSAQMGAQTSHLGEETRTLKQANDLQGEVNQTMQGVSQVRDPSGNGLKPGATIQAPSGNKYQWDGKQFIKVGDNSAPQQMADPNALAYG